MFNNLSLDKLRNAAEEYVCVGLWFVVCGLTRRPLKQAIICYESSLQSSVLFYRYYYIIYLPFQPYLVVCWVVGVNIGLGCVRV